MWRQSLLSRLSQNRSNVVSSFPLASNNAPGHFQQLQPEMDVCQGTTLRAHHIYPSETVYKQRQMQVLSITWPKWSCTHPCHAALKNRLVGTHFVQHCIYVATRDSPHCGRDCNKAVLERAAVELYINLKPCSQHCSGLQSTSLMYLTKVVSALEAR